jgi:hypothetical protein
VSAEAGPCIDEGAHDFSDPAIVRFEARSWTLLWGDRSTKEEVIWVCRRCGIQITGNWEPK